jgi:CRISPR-associated protein Csb2
MDVEQVQVEPICDAKGVFKVADRWRPIQFRRYRRKASDDGGRRLAGVFRLTFPAEIAGPICLGHSCHFGLGQFVPVWFS